MAGIQGSSSDNGVKDHQSVPAELCRMVWMVFGPVGVLFSGAALWKLPPGTFSILDGVFWGLLLLSLATKFVHVRVFQGMNTDNKPSTMADFWGYSVKLIVFAVAIWGLAQSFQA